MTDAPADSPEVIAASLRRRAAVVGVFDPLKLLAEVAPGQLDEAVEDRIFCALSGSIEEVADAKDVFWRLQPEARREALRELVTRDELDRTIAQTAPQRGDRFGQILQATLKKGAAGNAAVMQKMSTDELMLQALALDFARSLPARKNAREPAIDPRILLARQAERRRQNYVAPKTLFGRDRDSDALDRYVADGSVVPPLVDLAAPEDEPPRLRPLLLTGIGGSGKSALVADLMRRTQRQDWSGSIVVCLDFDQRNVALGGEREWLNELTRQIGFARPKLDPILSNVRKSARQQLHRLTQERADIDRLTGTDNLLIVSAMRDEMQKALSDGLRPAETLVVIADTFEEVLVRSDMRAASLNQEPFGLVLAFIDSLSKLVSPGGEPVFGAVRAVVAGRAHPFPEDEAKSARWFEASLEIGELDVDAAAEFLRDRGERRVFTKARAQNIAENIPRFPLVLILLADFARNRSAREIDEVINAAQGAGVLGAAASTRVLYSRFLDRLKDHVIKDANGERLVPQKDLVRLAHPGLALSMVTPDLIRHVLAVPAGLGEIDDQRARDLFEALSREVWLVERVGTDAVRHIPVLRRIMLPMLNGDLSPSENAGADMRDAVQAVHRAAARWYRSDGASDPNSAALAGYHDAFLGDLTALASDPSLVRHVLDIAGEDVSAMPIEARALLRREARTEEGLSIAEAASLPDEDRIKAELIRGSRRVKSGVTSRHLNIEDEEESAPAGLEGPLVAPAGLEAPFSAPPSSIEAGAITSAGYVGGQIDLLKNEEIARRIELMFAEADFQGVVDFGTPAAAHLCQIAQEEPPLEKLGDTTTHWTWKWALSCLACGAGNEALLKWAVPETRPINTPQTNTPFRIGTLLSLAIATVALGRTPSFKDEPPYRDAVKTYPVLEIAPVVSTLSLRLRVLANYWDRTRLQSMPRPFEIRPDLVQLVALWSPLPGTQVSIFGGSAPIASMTDGLRRRMSDFERDPPLSTELMKLEGSIRFPASDFQSELAPASTRLAIGSLLRGCSPELYDPVRAALGDAAAVDAPAFMEAVAEVAPYAAFWPIDLKFAPLENSLREVDYLLARLVSFIDLAGLTSTLFSILKLRRSFGRRFHAVARLVHAYDVLLLAPYDEFSLLPATRSENGELSSKAL